MSLHVSRPARCPLMPRRMRLTAVAGHTPGGTRPSRVVAMTGSAVGERPRLLVDLEGGLVHLRADYDRRLVALIRQLPDRHYVPERAEWIMRARRPALAELRELIERPELEVTLSERARRRLERHGPGRLTLDKGELRLAFPYNPRRLKRVRAIPERRFDPDSKSWIVPPTRAGALELLRLLDEGEFRGDVAVRRRLEALAAGQEEGGEQRQPRDDGEPCRESPIPHWRHVTRGAVFDANPQRQEWVDGVGWCVRIRVDPARHRRSEQAASRPAASSA
jgi:hypothetical protein